VDGCIPDQVLNAVTKKNSDTNSASSLLPVNLAMADVCRYICHVMLLAQVCSATSRLLLQDGIAEPFLERVAAAARHIVVGNPLETGTQMGPVVSAAQHKVMGGLSLANATLYKPSQSPYLPGPDFTN